MLKISYYLYLCNILIDYFPVATLPVIVQDLALNKICLNVFKSDLDSFLVEYLCDSYSFVVSFTLLIFVSCVEDLLPVKEGRSEQFKPRSQGHLLFCKQLLGIHFSCFEQFMRIRSRLKIQC